MIDIAELKSLCKDEKIVTTQHAKTRLIERKIGIDDIVNAIMLGEIIEQYEDDKPLPSCLVLGPAVSGKMCHLVVGYDGDYIYLITAYYPDGKIWKDDLRTRKEYD